jgi:hypothetical protein
LIGSHDFWRRVEAYPIGDPILQGEPQLFHPFVIDVVKTAKSLVNDGGPELAFLEWLSAAAQLVLLKPALPDKSHFPRRAKSVHLTQ